MEGFIEIPAENILEEAKKILPGFHDIPYIIYMSSEDARKKIRINTCYLPQGGKVRLNIHYDRGLCNTIEEYCHLPQKAIEEQAYGAWMDGAR